MATSKPAPGWRRQPSALSSAGRLARARRRGRKAHATHEFTDASRGERLQKIMAEAGVGSRRYCEQLIEAGEVRVNGHLIDRLPAWVDAMKDHITVRGRRIKPRAPAVSLVYVMLFKPRGVVSTNDDPEGRPRAIDLVQHPSKVRLYPVGRLDIESSGLLLLTNDGELANRLTHPRYEVHKLYELSVAGSLDDRAIRKLEAGLFLADRRMPRRGRTSAARGARPADSAAARTAPSSLRLLKRDRDRTRLLMELGEGRNRQIRRMMAQLGYKVRKLRRVAMGPLKLSGLQPGQWRELTYKELRQLKRAAGLSE